MRIVFLAVDTQWIDPSGEYASFSYAARKLEASILGAPDLAGAETSVVDLKTDDPERFFAEIRACRPTIVAASTYVWSVATFLQVARMVKEWDPSILFVMGGPAARASLLTLAPYRPLLRYVDAIAVGEGEEVMRALARGDALDTIPGLLIPHALGLRTTAPAVRPELDGYPSPYQIGSAPTARTGFIETFRGCPISCAFCQWGDQRSDRVYGAEYLASHLRGLVASEATNVFFTDAAFNLSARAFRNLVQAEREVGAFSKLAVHGHFYPTHLKQEHLDFLTRVGKAQVAIGVQTFDPEVLKKLGRPFDLDRFEAVLRELRGVIPIDVELIYGLPGDNARSFRHTLDRTLELADTVRVFLPLVLPDALLERADEFKISFDPNTFVIEQCDGWTARDLTDGWEEIVRSTEGLPNRMVASSWLGFMTRSGAERTETVAAPRGAAVLASEQASKLSVRLSALVAGWSIVGARRENQGLLVELGSPSGAIVLDVSLAAPGAPSFVRRGGLSYSYRGTVDPSTAASLGRVIEALHPTTVRLLAATEAH